MAKKESLSEYWQRVKSMPDGAIGDPDFKDDPDFVPASVPNYKDRVVYKNETRVHMKNWLKLLKFTHSSTQAAVIMLIGAIIAVIIANSPFYDSFLAVLNTEVGFVLGTGEATLTIGEVINDIFMAIFFLLVGLDIKYEMTVGELKNLRQALLPIIAACGGVAMPALIYTIINLGNPATASGWGVPTATDIAFALGIMSLLGPRVPNGVKVFLSTLAVADDIIAILVIAIFYGQSPSFIWLGAAAVVMVVLVLMNRTHIYSIKAYLLVGVVLWFCVFQSGIHSTIAGVLLAFTIPTTSRINLRTYSNWAKGKIGEAAETLDQEQPVVAQDLFMRQVNTLGAVSKQVVPPATRLEHTLYPWVYFMILPLFALTNADVSFAGLDLGVMFSNTALLGVFLGLLLGKPIGIMLASFIVVKTKIASLPTNVNWIHMLGAAILGGVGFTMAIFVSNLAYTDPEMITMAKAGILSASTLAGIIGFTFLFIQANMAKKAGIAYVQTNTMDAARMSNDTQSAEDVSDALEEAHVSSASIREQIEAALAENPDVTEIAVQIEEPEPEFDADSRYIS